jgi:hypothetical protein
MADQVVSEIAFRDLAGAVDVFCDPVAFTVEECRTVLTAAKAKGFAIKLHAEQFDRTGGAMLAAELGAVSADHLESASEEDWQALAKAGVVGVLLPGAALTLRQSLPDAEMLRRSGARVAIATDFNPGTSPSQSLLECAALASRQCGFTADEALLAITWNAAKALGLEGQVGHLNPGACGDAVEWECETSRSCPTGSPPCARQRLHARRRPGVPYRGAEGVAVTRLVECVPNFSEGRRPEVIEELIQVIASVAGVTLLDRESDPDHNRSVLTFAGEPEPVAEAAFRVVERAAKLIDLNHHTGQHPRMGATDVVPFVPVENLTLDDCAEIARRVGRASAQSWRSRSSSTKRRRHARSARASPTCGAASSRGCAS